jgi:hypothetical protein
MKDVLAVVGVLAIGIVGFAFIKKQMHKKDDCGCGCGGNCKEDKIPNIQPIVQPTTQEDCGCGGRGLGEGWLTNYNLQEEFKDSTISRA